MVTAAAPMGRREAVGERTVLVVDDDLDLRLTLADALSLSGFRVVGASNGREALDLLRDNAVRPDVILLDMMMPEMDGWGFREAQRKLDSIASIPVVLFSAYQLGQETLDQLGAAGYLKKPVTLADLVETLRGAVQSD